jgi:Ca2+-binding RTX toxin-like protein
VEISSTANQAEWARVDFIEFRPAGSLPRDGTAAGETLSGGAGHELLRGLGGDDRLVGGGGNDTLIGGTGRDTLVGGEGSDTASFAGSASGVRADLALGLAAHVTRLMPLGDSITLGRTESKTGFVSGGYRPVLWDLLGETGVSFDYVGPNDNPVAGLPDGHHAGFAGETIDNLDGRDNGLVATYRPDVTLLLAGTNDTRTDSVATMLTELRALLTSLTQAAPDMLLLVATIPPIDPAEQSAERVAKVSPYNAGVADLVAEFAAAGRKIGFVDMRGLTLADISDTDVDNGLHPNDQGYAKIAQWWEQALAAHTDPVLGTLDTNVDVLEGIENLTGTSFADQLSGNGGANTLEGGAGADLLRGNGGADAFVFRTPGEGGDTIADFSRAQGDKVVIAAGGFGAGLAPGALPASAFASGTSPVAPSAATRFFYETDAGALWWDQDGSGAVQPVKLVTLTNAPAFDANDIFLIA